mgnify:CR=1 FL=1
MGQKTHPLGFRLGITQEHRSSWYANFKHYSTLLQEDDKIRTYLNKFAKFASISNVHINRNGLGDQIELNIETGRPGILVGDNGSQIKTLATNIKKFLPDNHQITINVIEVENINSVEVRDIKIEFVVNSKSIFQKYYPLLNTLYFFL